MTLPTILFGIGAMKAGTTSLYFYLKGHPQVHVRAVKELHYFNYLENKVSDGIRKRQRGPGMVGAVVQKLKGLRSQARPEAERDLQKLRQVANHPDPTHSGYVNYLCEGANGARVVADITPAYSVVSAGSFRAMARLGETRRFLFVMRDPVSRLLSNIRHMTSRRKFGYAKEERALANFRRVLSGDRQDMLERSDYEGTLTRLWASVPQEETKVIFFEDFIRGRCTEETAEFLGIDPLPMDTARMANRSEAIPLPGDVAARALDILRPQYDFVLKHFGDAVPDEWIKRLEAA